MLAHMEQDSTEDLEREYVLYLDEMARKAWASEQEEN